MEMVFSVSYSQSGNVDCNSNVRNQSGILIFIGVVWKRVCTLVMSYHMITITSR